MLLERYQVLGVIGQGGMGTVFKGYHVNLKRHVAIKTLRIDKITTPDSVSRFRQEMELVGQMDHPNVVRATDAGEKNGVFYLVMEFLSGCDLGTLVARRGPLALADACELIRQAAVGLDYIHQMLVHRDIKPSNLMLTANGLVKVLDLGLARCDLAHLGEREETPFGYAVGTFSYMAPEQAGGVRNIDGRADIYSLGCTLFKLLTGKTPFSGPEYDNVAKQLHAHCSVPLSSVAEFAALPEAIKPVLLRMTAKDPNDRYATAAEAAEALAPFTGGCRLERLLGGLGEAAVAPVPTPAPVELTRLTESYQETPRDTPTVTVETPPPPPGRPDWKTRGALAACAVVAALAVLYWVWPLLMPAPNRKDPNVDEDKAELRNLDELPPHVYATLLERKPLPVGCPLDDPRSYAWEKGLQQLTVKGNHNTLFLLGTTTRSRYSVSAAIEQGPWTGQVGVFWGYHEFPDVKAQTDVPGNDFAKFQMLVLWHNKDAGRDVYAVQRGRGSLRYNKRGDVVPKIFARINEEVRLRPGPVVLEFEIEDRKLKHVRLGSAELKTLCSAELQSEFQNDLYTGAVGVVTLTHGATFTNARFIAHSVK